MRNVRSATHRTNVMVDVHEDGTTLVIITRNDRVVERIDLAAEHGLNSAKRLEKHDWGVRVMEMTGQPAREEVVETIVFEGETEITDG